MALPNKIESPQTTLLPLLSSEDAAMMAYPPTPLPGPRNVESFYGTMRVYEWGPADGKKVLFVHGDATPCLVFARIAQGLVDAGYRVLLFDLWGRGYSDTPLGVRLDDRLFASQILLALISSPISSWMADSFSIIGFSLGGPIALAFAGAFPSSVRSLVLLGPAGLLRKLPPGYDHRLLHNPELAPSQESVREVVRQILDVASAGPALRLGERRAVSLGPSPTRVEQDFDMGALLQWQFDHQQGHVYAYQETIRHFRIQNRLDLWGKVCDIISGKTCVEVDTALRHSKLLVFFGEDDGLVVGKETHEDILSFLPATFLQVEYLPGGHGFPYPYADKIVEAILACWDATPSVL
ncbi:Alpha/Beta hydrolase protein [Xylariomycetidae sp. FL2044]|nr:Alpha/Beta hydrolase protein [Xylariomycetidae sp. FL2044]